MTDVAELRASIDREELGRKLHDGVGEMYPWLRSITGDGVRRTLEWIGDRLPIEVHEVPSGTPVLDWTVPDEWNVREAWVEGPDGERIVDVADHTLHLVSYSVPIETTLPREELDEHLHSIPKHPDWIPYRTAYYSRTWGFCLPHRQRERLPEGEYRVRIDASLEAGHLTYGELVLPGESEAEVLFSTHVCHPSLANDNLSGIAVATALADRLGSLRQADRRLTYRFLFVPGTIGAITWLARNREESDRVVAGLVLANLGDPGAFHYKRSRRGDALVDRAVAHALTADGDDEPAGQVRDFVPFGYDERQYCSPGFDLPVGLFNRSTHGSFPEYHTSADDLDLVEPDALAGSVEKLLEIVEILEEERRYENLAPHGEPQLGRRGLYRDIGGGSEGRERELALLWVLNQSDGERCLLEIAERSGMPFARLREAAEVLVEAELLRPLSRDWPAG